MERAIRNRGLTESVFFHSDRGSQYASYAFRRLLVNNHIRHSMNSKGNCYDNAMTESFIKFLKTELIYQKKYQTRQEAKQDIFEYIEVFSTARGCNLLCVTKHLLNMQKWIYKILLNANSTFLYEVHRTHNMKLFNTQ